MIYFDNAATGGFKPRAVTDAAETVIRYLSANPGRSGHRLSVSGAGIVYDCRNNLAELFGAKKRAGYLYEKLHGSAKRRYFRLSKFRRPRYNHRFRT